MTSGPPDIDPNASGTPEPEVTPVAVTAAAAAQGPSRPAALAGRFYAGEAERLAAEVDGHLKAARRERKSLEIPAPKALIAPHAGHVYSGPTAARAYIRLDPVRSKIKRVVLFGPTHHVGFTGLALSGAGSFETPLGSIPVDRAWEGRLQGMASVGVMKEAHSKEHSLEVHLPFLQRVLGDFALVPVVCGRATPEAVAKVMEVLWGGPETLVVVSTDLSHFLDYMTCRSKDAGTAAAIEALNTEVIGPQEACGHIGVKGLMTLAKQRNLKLKRIDVCNSGDTAGDKGRVVGYGAWSLTEPLGGMKTQQSAVETAERIVTDHGAKLLSLAARAIRHGHRHGQAPDLTGARVPRLLAAPGAAFVTLSRADNDQLRGCIGSVQAHRPLAVDVSTNAWSAANKDPRFKPVTPEELVELALSVSILSKPEPLPVAGEADLLEKMRPGIDGLIFSDQGKRGLFLPQVWESLPDRISFLAGLKRKAGLPETYWSPTVRIERFEARSAKSKDLPDPGRLWADAADA